MSALARYPGEELQPLPSAAGDRSIAAEQDLLEVLDGVSACLFEAGPDLRFIRLRGPVVLVTGFDVQHLASKTIEDLVADRDNPAVARGIAGLHALEPYDFIFQLKSPGGPRFIRAIGRPQYGRSERFCGYRGLISNITAYVEAERKAAVTYRRLAEALESVPASIMLFDPEDRIAFCNSATRHFFPKANHLLVTGTQFEDLLRGDIGGGNGWTVSMGREEWVQERMAHHRHADGNLVGQRPDGCWVQVIERRTSDGATIGVRIDITEEKNREAELKLKSEEVEEHSRELQRSNAELEQFAYVASHDLQEPLRMVASYCQLLQRRYQDKLDADANDFIGYAVEGATRMQRLINDLLNYSRVGRKGREFAPVRVGEAVKIALSNLRGVIADNGVQIEAGELPTILGDTTLLVQLFQNLIGNGIKFRREETPVIRIDAMLAQPFWHFVVEDNGIGIEPDHLQRVFLIFQRLHERSKYPGTGIGLAVAKKVVEHHGGRIWIDSVPGQGSCFHFTLPTLPEKDCSDA